MDLKRFENLRDAKDKIRDEIRALDNVLILDSEIVNIFKANNISLEDISKLLSIKSFPDYATMFSYWDSGGEMSFDVNSLNYLLKILSMSKNDLAYIISKIRVLRKIFNIGEDCYFRSLKLKLENTKDVSTKDKLIESSTLDTDIKELSSELLSKIDEGINILSQVLTMVNESIELKFEASDQLFINVNEQVKIKELLNFTAGESICLDGSRAIMFNESGALAVYSDSTLRGIVAGDSEIAIKLYEDLLVGYKYNKKTAVYYSGLFTKYIIS